MFKLDFSKKSCTNFIEILSSKSPIPGGGGAAALVGAIGIALGNMVGNLTLGKKKYQDVEEDIKKLIDKATKLQDDFLILINEDAKIFEPLSKAYKLPKDTEEEKLYKMKVLEGALKNACSIPLLIMEKSCEAIELHEQFALKGTKFAISDVGCGVTCCRSALLAASLNIYINTKSITDKKFVDETNKKVEKMIEKYIPIADEIFLNVQKKFL